MHNDPEKASLLAHLLADRRYAAMLGLGLSAGTSLSSCVCDAVRLAVGGQSSDFETIGLMSELTIAYKFKLFGRRFSTNTTRRFSARFSAPPWLDRCLADGRNAGARRRRLRRSGSLAGLHCRFLPGPRRRGGDAGRDDRRLAHHGSSARQAIGHDGHFRDGIPRRRARRRRLRTCFPLVDEKPVQSIQPDLEIYLPLIPLHHVPVEARARWRTRCLSDRKNAPVPRAVQAVGRILPTPILGGTAFVGADFPDPGRVVGNPHRHLRTGSTPGSRSMPKSGIVNPMIDAQSFVRMPSRVGLGSAFAQVRRDHRPEMVHPAPNGLVGDHDPTLSQPDPRHPGSSKSVNLTYSQIACWMISGRKR